MKKKTKEKYVWLNNADLYVNPRIQRKLDPERVRKIASQFSPLVANPIKVSYRDGRYYIFDGMHTRAAIRLLNGSDNFPILCRVYNGLTEEDEAKLFSMQFGVSEDLSMIYRLRALEVAKDPDVLQFLQATRDAGFKITLGSCKSANGHIAACCEAYKSYHALGSVDYTTMLMMLHRTWAGESWSVTRNMISGMTRFVQMYEVETDDFIRALRETTYQEVKDVADRFRGMTREGAFASALAEIYGRMK